MLKYPAYLQRSMELLGEKHYLRRSLLAKLRYFEGYNLFKNVGEFQADPARRDSFKLAALAKFHESLDLQPAAAYVYFAIGQSYSQEINTTYQSDSVYRWCQKALESAPGWLLPYLQIAEEYGNGQGDNANAEVWLNKALAIAPESYLVLERLSWLKQWEFQPDSSLAISRRMIALRPDIFNAYSTAAQTLSYMKGDWLASEKYCDQSLALEPDNQLWWAYAIQGINYLKTRRTELAIAHLKKGLARPNASLFDKSALNFRLVMALVQKGDFAEAEKFCLLARTEATNNPTTNSWRECQAGKLYLAQNRLPEAEKCLLSVFTIDPTTNEAWSLANALLGELEAKRGQLAAAAAYFQKVETSDLPYRCLFGDEALFIYGN